MNSGCMKNCYHGLVKKVTKVSRPFIPVLVLLATVLLYEGIYTLFVRPYRNPISIYHSPAIRNIGKISVGYTLIAPYNNTLNADPNNWGSVYLLDLTGRAVHDWKTTRQVLSAQMKKNGNLLVAMEPSQLSNQFPGGGNTGVLEEVDWNGKIVWRHIDEAMHHDFAQLPNGNIAYARWEVTPPAVAKRVQGGIPGTELNGQMWSDEIVEVDRDGKIVWSWHAYEHLHPENDIPRPQELRRGWYASVIDPALTRAGWTYVNGIQHVPHNPLDGEEAYLASMRSLDTIMLIRKRDGEIIWQSQKDLLNTQHDPNMLPNGNIVAFDNGFARLPIPIPRYGSRVIEVNPKTDEVVWTFDGGKGVMDKLTFFGPLVGGSQPLPNGNILITDGPRGHIFEVTKQGEVVWDMVSPYETERTGAFPVNFLFKARRYSKNDVQFPSSLPDPTNMMLYTIANTLAPLYPTR